MNINIGKVLLGWFGGSYEDAGLFETKEDAERGISSWNKLHNEFSEYEGKRIKITIEIVEE